MSDTSVSMSLDQFLKSEISVSPSAKGQPKSAIRVALDTFVESSDKFVVWHGDTMPRYTNKEGTDLSATASFSKAKSILAAYAQYRESNDKASEVLWYQDNGTATLFLLNLRTATPEEVAAFKARQPGEVKGLPKA